MGALGPETLKHKHQLPEPQILHIYGLLHRHCTGFQQEVQVATAGAEHREGLLAHIWTAFAQLWDECTQVSCFGGPCPSFSSTLQQQEAWFLLGSPVDISVGVAATGGLGPLSTSTCCCCLWPY